MTQNNRDLVADIELIKSVAGDIDEGYIHSTKKVRGNIGGIITRACDRLSAALQPQSVNQQLLEACDVALKALLNPNPRNADGWRIPADNAIYVLGKAIASAASSKPEANHDQ